MRKIGTKEEGEGGIAFEKDVRRRRIKRARFLQFFTVTHHRVHTASRAATSYTHTPQSDPNLRAREKRPLVLSQMLVSSTKWSKTVGASQRNYWDGSLRWVTNDLVEGKRGRAQRCMRALVRVQAARGHTTERIHGSHTEDR